MSNKKPTEAEVPSSIVVDDFSSAVPGVTMLLNPKVILEREAARKRGETQVPATQEPEPSLPPPLLTTEPMAESQPDGGIEISLSFDSEPVHSAPEPLIASEPEPKPESKPDSLSQMGVQLELQFQEDGSGFRFQKILPHAQSSVEDWQEKVFRGMRLELEILGIQVSFQEYSSKKDFFQTDAFCVPEGSYVQIVRSREHSDRLYVLITKRSLLLDREQVYTALEGSGENSSGEGGGIVIDFAS